MPTDDLSECSFDIFNQKSQIVYDRLKELGIEFDPAIESEKRFKSMGIEFHHDVNGYTEIYYYNDGTIEGRKIATFSYKRADSFGLKIQKGKDRYYMNTGITYELH